MWIRRGPSAVVWQAEVVQWSTGLFAVDRTERVNVDESLGEWKRHTRNRTGYGSITRSPYFFPLAPIESQKVQDSTGVRIRSLFC
jgi:hypothetical protein